MKGRLAYSVRTWHGRSSSWVCHFVGKLWLDNQSTISDLTYLGQRVLSTTVYSTLNRHTNHIGKQTNPSKMLKLRIIAKKQASADLQPKGDMITYETQVNGCWWGRLLDTDCSSSGPCAHNPVAKSHLPVDSRNVFIHQQFQCFVWGCLFGIHWDRSKLIYSTSLSFTCHSGATTKSWVQK